MATATKKSFTDLPSKIRNHIYEEYMEGVDETTLHFSCGRFIVPPLAHTSTQVRSEFLSYWNSRERDFKGTKHIIAQVIDLDYGPLMRLHDQAAKHMQDTDAGFKTFKVALIFTEQWKLDARAHDKMKEHEKWCDGVNYWVAEDGWDITASWPWPHIGLSHTRALRIRLQRYKNFEIEIEALKKLSGMRGCSD